MRFVHWLLLSRQRRTVLSVGLAVAVIAAVVLVVVFHESGVHPSAAPSATPSVSPSHSSGLVARESGGAYPAEAQAAVDQLVSGDEAAQRRVVIPELQQGLPAGRLFPVGSILKLDDTSWHISDRYANATGTLQVPNEAPRRVEVGFVNRDGAWLVTYVEKLP